MAYSDNTYSAHKNSTSGRCRPCNLLYNWRTRATSRLSRARCRYCGGILDQTTASNIKVYNVHAAVVPPVFAGISDDITLDRWEQDVREWLDTRYGWCPLQTTLFCDRADDLFEQARMIRS